MQHLLYYLQKERNLDLTFQNKVHTHSTTSWHDVEKAIKEKKGTLFLTDDLRKIKSFLEQSKQFEETQKQLQESEERYALAAQGTQDGLWDWNLSQETIYYSHRWAEMIGFSAHHLSHTSEEWFSRVHPDDMTLLGAALEAHKNGATKQFRCE